MGLKAADALEIKLDELATYLRTNHSAYMDIEGKGYYLTDVNEHAWRVQDTEQLNDKGHFTDASELVDTVSEFVALPFYDGKSISDLFDQATFFASEKPEE